ncbi:cysteine-rich CWC family protein [Vibrio sp.]|uniref:DUF1289 domain-containing protein n=1 Tax=Vibrio viridaestus TaxID=2487322 RepID=A0A3N9UA17_9VIBR|nr:cysteine-rich CWC family protein [Vibrio viridaestus]MDC0611861.1 cysteine-rich CWC family protein [Vibrio sp.]RQW65186.1 DUF1289 domain-containing protein [Vibrio viridaestus]
MKSPCVAACKNNGGICNGCNRTIKEIIGWKNYSEEYREQVIEQLHGQLTTHSCPECGEPAYCGIANGEEKCWCFDVEERESINGIEQCVCRSCLKSRPVA